MTVIMTIEAHTCSKPSTKVISIEREYISIVVNKANALLYRNISSLQLKRSLFNRSFLVLLLCRKAFVCLPLHLVLFDRCFVGKELKKNINKWNYFLSFHSHFTKESARAFHYTLAHYLLTLFCVSKLHKSTVQALVAII